MTTTPHLLRGLKTKGHRITRTRRFIIDILSNAKSPLSVLELIARLKRRDLPVNKTTVYREIEFLLGEKVIREIDLLEGKKRYEMLLDGSHHHHIVCTQCKAIRCVDMDKDLDVLERYILKHYDFQVLNHTLEFFGLCSGCR